jgi:hypothetical protein
VVDVHITNNDDVGFVMMMHFAELLDLPHLQTGWHMMGYQKRSKNYVVLQTLRPFNLHHPLPQLRSCW